MRVFRSSLIVVSASVLAFACQQMEREGEEQPEAAPGDAQPETPPGEQPEAAPRGEPEVEAQGPSGASAEELTRMGRAALKDESDQTVADVEFLPVPVGVAVHIKGTKLPPGPIDLDIRPDATCETIAQQQEAGQPPAFPLRIPQQMAEPEGKSDVYFVIPGSTLLQGQPGSLMGQQGKAAVLVRLGGEQPAGEAGEVAERFACGDVELTEPGERQM